MVKKNIVFANFCDFNANWIFQNSRVYRVGLILERDGLFPYVTSLTRSGNLFTKPRSSLGYRPPAPKSIVSDNKIKEFEGSFISTH
jgi:hypothetical protein